MATSTRAFWKAVKTIPPACFQSETIALWYPLTGGVLFPIMVLVLLLPPPPFLYLDDEEREGEEYMTSRLYRFGQVRG